MRRASLIRTAVLLTLAACALLLSAALPSRATAAGGLKAAAEAREEAVVRLLILERHVADAETGLAQAQDRLRRSQAAAAEWTQRAEKATAHLDTARQHYADRVVEAYKTGDMGWLELLFSSDDFSQFVGRTVLIGKILAQDAILATKVERAQANAQEAAGQAESAAREQEAQVRALRTIRDDLEAAEREQGALVDALGDRLTAARAAARAAAQRMAEVNETARRDDASTTATTNVPATITGSPSRQGRQLTVKSYAYALRGTTATGVPVAPGVIAVDPRVIPLGTRMYVPGYGEGIAADTGGDIKGNTIDVWMSSEQAASDWGIKRLTITVYD